MFIDKIFIKKVDRGYLMKKNVRVLLTVLVIIIAAVGGYFVYRGQDTSNCHGWGIEHLRPGDG